VTSGLRATPQTSSNSSVASHIWDHGLGGKDDFRVG
jgi:hypothetical protein